MSYTKGPWHWDSDPIKNDPFGRVRFRVCTLGRTITQCYHSSGDEYAESETRLISAAPDLLEALQIARDYVKAEIVQLRAAFGGYEKAGHIPEAEADLAMIDAAIAKAISP